MSAPAAAASASAAAINTPKTVNESQLTVDATPLGVGATATVFRAAYNGATFAFKKFHPNTDNSVRRELAAAVKLASHPSILTPLFVVVSGSNNNSNDDIVGVLLEVMPNGSVANRLKTLAQQQQQQQNSSPPLLLLAVRWALDLATGLEAAHQLGVLHGDIKPDNLLLTATDKLKITDLGSAHVLSTVGATAATGMRGTPLFMAPEHADGEPLTAACDVFSFGMTLWQMLHPAVTHPFGANVTSPMQISKRIDKGERPAIDKQLVPPALEQLIARCWDGDPAKRPTITDAAVELLAIQQSLQPKPVPPTQQGAQAQQQQQVSRPFACLPASFRPSGPLIACLEQLLHPSYRSDKMQELLHFHQHHSPFLRIRYGVTDDEALALTFYTMDLNSQTPGVLNPFQILNRALASRATSAEMQPLLPWIFHLHSAITTKLPATRCNSVYRGMKGVALSQSTHYAQGRHVWWPAFTSTTTQHATMIDFAAANGTLIIIEDAVGVDISAFSLYPESEVLLPPNSHFIVKAALAADAAGAVLNVMLGPQTATTALQTAPRVVNADLIVLKQQPVTAQDSIVDGTAVADVDLSSLPHSKCSGCNRLRITEQVFNASNRAVVELAVCAKDECRSQWPTALDVSDKSTATAALPPIPPTATCVAVTELNSKAAAWIATSSNIRTVCIVDSVKVDPALPPLPQVQRLFFLNKNDCGFTLQLADADRFAATFPNLLEVCARYIATDTTLASLAKCVKLHSLDVSVCDAITDTGLQHLRGLTALHLLCLGYSSTTDSGLQHLRELAALQSLDLTKCDKITDAGLQHLRGLKPLQSLNLGSCKRITDAGLQHLLGLPALQSLDLGNCVKITDAGLQHLRGLTALQSLDLLGCGKITDAGLQHLRGLTALQSLNLLGCGKITDAGLQHLRGLTVLQSLSLFLCDKITDAGLQHLRGLTALQSLDLSSCGKITDAGLQHLRGLPALQSLDLGWDAQITDAGLRHLRGLTALQSLDLHNCKLITDAGLQHLRGVTSLRTLNLEGCKQITVAAKQALRSAIPTLEILDLFDSAPATTSAPATVQQHSTHLHTRNQVSDQNESGSTTNHPTKHIDDYLLNVVAPRFKRGEPELLEKLTDAVYYAFNEKQVPPTLDTIAQYFKNVPKPTFRGSYDDLVLPRINVVNEDCLVQCQKLVSSAHTMQFQNVCLVNVGDEDLCGGGFTATTGGSEQYLFRCSTLSLNLWKRRLHGQDSIWPWPVGTQLLGPPCANPDDVFYPLTKYGVIYSKRVEVFALNDVLLPPNERFNISALTMAAQDLRSHSCAPFDRELNLRKFRALFYTAAKSHCDALVLNATGFGEFRCDPIAIAGCVRQVLDELCGSFATPETFPFKRIDIVAGANDLNVFREVLQLAMKCSVAASSQSKPNAAPQVVSGLSTTAATATPPVPVSIPVAIASGAAVVDVAPQQQQQFQQQAQLHHQQYQQQPQLVQHPLLSVHPQQRKKGYPGDGLYFKKDEAELQPKSGVEKCPGCSAGFGAFRWRYNCYSCGQVFCNDCAPKMRVQEKLETRVCDRCARDKMGIYRKRH